VLFNEWWSCHPVCFDNLKFLGLFLCPTLGGRSHHQSPSVLKATIISFVCFSYPPASQFGYHKNKYNFIYFMLADFPKKHLLKLGRKVHYMWTYNSQWEWCKFHWGSIYHGLAPFVLLVALYKLPCGTSIKLNNIQITNDYFKVLIVSNKNYFILSSDKYLTTFFIFFIRLSLKRLGGKICEPTNKITLA
jgi:hypothetical protein